jgi:unsaturated pyranuronate lyase
MMMTGFHKLADLPLERVTDQYSRRVLVGDNEMIIWASLKGGSHAASHSHPHEQMFWVTSGRMEFRLGEERRVCEPGDLVVVPGGMEHEAWYPVDTDFVTVLSPPRADHLPGAPAPKHMVPQ